MTSRLRESPIVWTIGHSNTDLDTFIELLETHDIGCVVDVRTAPYSRHVPHFNTKPFRHALEAAGITYVYRGDVLGGRIEDADGARPRTYAEAADDPAFLSGIDQLLERAGEKNTAVMCAEKDPNRCHRRHIIAAYLDEHHVEVRHILTDEAVVSEAELMGLFGKRL
jgi:uncharacterized protein (DUF488 family)